jgi:hypothetical protein
MIEEHTPYKLAEITRDTWPNLFYLAGAKPAQISMKKSEESNLGIISSHFTTTTRMV